ncbi:hypothetical protein GHT06_020837 [Daphnia sinensis]|uniref:Cuticle protein n=1 Tax=Daphnia sinensis TaxID=1820382 RepID=A0AAD5KJN1_9CRUS|nr:hypothetical protein GHT06_020837 [Daphnia sinensis]
MKFFILAALFAVAAASSYRAPEYAPKYEAPKYEAPKYEAPKYEEVTYAPQPYSFGYDVQDKESYNDFDHSEKSDSYGVSGSYRVALPDGRTQIVTYKADSYGYVADVKYEGEAQYPEYKPTEYKAAAYPAPAYKAPEYKAPAYTAPAYKAPEYKAPEYKAPTYTAPAYKAPAYEAPAYTAPIYRAPAPAYTAPVYTAPAFIILVALFAVAAADSYKAAEYAPKYEAPKYEEVTYAPQPYSFGYDVQDKESYNDFDHSEKSDSYGVTGSYRVALPDGRTQIVTYKANKDGYTADVKFEGEAKYPEYKEAEFPVTLGIKTRTATVTGISSATFIILVALFAVAAADSYKAAEYAPKYETPKYEEVTYAPQPYSFGYDVQDKESYNDFDHSEKSDSYGVSGSYRVALPDGRTQIVTYKADKNGYTADFLILVALFAVVAADSYKAEEYTPKYEAPVTYAPQPYSFGYEVQDKESYNDFDHAEKADGKVVTGSYRVALPDGRTQIVTYKADENGYTADVKFEGEAKYPEYKAASYPAPTYTTPAYPAAAEN